MIYKFICTESCSTMELYSLNSDEEKRNSLVFDVTDGDYHHYICLDKKDVYHLIGALHLLHKEMK